jgi:hypothetical protein
VVPVAAEPEPAPVAEPEAPVAADPLAGFDFPWAGPKGTEAVEAPVVAVGDEDRPLALDLDALEDAPVVTPSADVFEVGTVSEPQVQAPLVEAVAPAPAVAAIELERLPMAPPAAPKPAFRPTPAPSLPASGVRPSAAALRPPMPSFGMPKLSGVGGGAPKAPFVKAAPLAMPTMRMAAPAAPQRPVIRVDLMELDGCDVREVEVLVTVLTKSGAIIGEGKRAASLPEGGGLDFFLEVKRS